MGRRFSLFFSRHCPMPSPTSLQLSSLPHDVTESYTTPYTFQKTLLVSLLFFSLPMAHVSESDSAVVRC